MEDCCIKFGIYIKERRKELGLSQAEVARKLGIHQVAYGRYELGSREVDLPTIFKLEKALNFSFDEFYSLYKENNK